MYLTGVNAGSSSSSCAHLRPPNAKLFARPQRSCLSHMMEWKGTAVPESDTLLLFPLLILSVLSSITGALLTRHRCLYSTHACVKPALANILNAASCVFLRAFSRGGIAERKGKKRLYDVQNGKCSSRRPTASRRQNTLPLHGPGAKARQGWTQLVLGGWRSALYGPEFRNKVLLGSTTERICFATSL